MMEDKCLTCKKLHMGVTRIHPDGPYSFEVACAYEDNNVYEEDKECNDYEPNEYGRALLEMQRGLLETQVGVFSL